MNTMQYKRSLLISACCLLLGLATAPAAVVESFETLTLTPGTNVTGDASIQMSYNGVAPTDGTKQLLLTTINNTSGNGDFGTPNVSGNNAVSQASLNSFLGYIPANFSEGIGKNATEGSAFKLTLALNVGDVVSFNYSFLTNDSTFRDFAFASLTGAPNSVVADTMNANTSATGFFSSKTADGITYSFPMIASAGSYTLTLGVADRGNTSTDDSASGLLIDKISVSPVPEQSVVVLCGMGLGLLVVVRRSLRRA